LTNKGNGKLKKDNGKWFEFHKIPWNNTNECRSKQLLLAETKSSGLDVESNSYLEPEKRKWIIYIEPNVTIATIKFHPKEP
jgi:hypothetical protein